MSQRDLYAQGGLTRWYWDYRDRAVMQNIPKDANSILDVGCGEGITLQKLTGRRILGIDPDPKNVMVCHGKGLTAWMMSVYGLRAAKIRGGWDCVLLLDVIEHLEAPISALKQIQGVMAKDGRLIVMFPDDYLFFIARLLCGKFKEAFNDSGHVKKWWPWQMKTALREVGCRVEKVQRLPLHWIVVGRKV